MLATFKNESTLIVGIYDENDNIGVSTEFFPRLSESGLSSQVPQLHGDLSLISFGLPFLI